MFSSDTVAAAHQLSEGRLRPHVRVLAAGRQEPAELSGDTAVPTAEKSRLQTRGLDTSQPVPLLRLPTTTGHTGIRTRILSYEKYRPRGDSRRSRPCRRINGQSVLAQSCSRRMRSGKKCITTVVFRTFLAFPSRFYVVFFFFYTRV